ncbi:MAG TPA: GIY-YIG nuclease family protein [Dehalococcoidia bacterium]
MRTRSRRTRGRPSASDYLRRGRHGFNVAWARNPFVLSLSKGARFDLLPSFHVYILRCADGSFYTGHTDDLAQRMQIHLEAPPRAYTSSRLPVRLAWTQELPTRADALEAERQIKGWSRAKKEALIKGDWETISRLAHTHGSATSNRSTAIPGQDSRSSTHSGRTDSPAAPPLRLPEGTQHANPDRPKTVRDQESRPSTHSGRMDSETAPLVRQSVLGPRPYKADLSPWQR